MRYRLWPFIVIGSLLGLTAAALLKQQGAEDEAQPLATMTLPKSQSARSASRKMFTYNHGRTPQREILATDSRYNPVVFLREDDLTPKEIYDNEPRDNVYAPILERRIQIGYSDAFKELGIDQKIRSLKVECKTLSCYSSIEVAKEDGDYVYGRISGLLLGDLHSPGLTEADSPDLMRVTFHTLWEPDMRDEQTFRTFMEVAFSSLVRASKLAYPPSENE